MDDDVTETQDELEAARAEIDRLEAMAADREAKAAHLESQLAALRQELVGAREETQAREREVAGLVERSTALESQVRASAERYRVLALERSPELPEELVGGETVEAIDEAIERARETVAKVRGHIESQAQAGRVPAGAPIRSAPDLSGLSAEEKIRLGLGRAGRS